MSGSTALIDEALRQARNAMQAGALKEAEAAYRFVLASLPQHPEANHNLSLIMVNTDRLAEAERRMEKMVKVAPNDAASHLLLGRITALTGKATRSIFLLRRAMDLYPNDVNLWLEVIALIGRQNRPADAERAAQAAIRQFPADADLYLQAGLAWLNNGDEGRARFWFNLALEVKPDHAAAMFQIAGLDEADGEFGHALRGYRRARELDTNNQLRDFSLGDLELRNGMLDEALVTLADRVAKYPNDLVANANLLMALQYKPGMTIESLRDAHARWEAVFGAPLRQSWTPHANAPSPDRKLRIGLVSGDFCEHPVGYFTVAAIEALDPTLFDVVCYTDHPTHDPIAQRFRARADAWRETEGWPDEQLANTIRADNIDILIDMAGQTTYTRLLTFARKPAPVQLSWAGYFGTTGSDAIDGLLLDGTLVHPDEDGLYREKIWRLPHGYLCYDKPLDAPAVVARAEADVVKFAAFHNIAKINRDVVALWARVVHAVAPQKAQINFAYGGFHDPDVQARIIAWFAEQGVAADNLTFSGNRARQDYFTALGENDIGLDPFPYSGGAITCDALWMGVPVITLPGQTVAGRHSATHLHAAGLDELIARDEDDYVAKVVALANDPQRLAALREGLRPQLAASPLCDGPGFAADLGALLREVWADYIVRSVEQA